MKQYMAVYKKDKNDTEWFKHFSSTEGYENFKMENPAYLFYGLFEKICD